MDTLDGIAPLGAFGVLRIRGEDARTFLQGQLSNDVRKLSAKSAQLTTLNTATGRVQAVLTLVEPEDTEEILAIVHCSILSSTLARLRSRVLRSRVEIDEVSRAWSLQSISPLGVRQLGGHELRTPGACESRPLGTVLRWWSRDERYVLLCPGPAAQSTASAAAPPALDPESAEHLRTGAGIDLQWKREDIRTGIPHVYPETSELFVAQMLNLEQLGAISFDKGCYIGQEVIARAHYRHTVTRRMYRLRTCAEPPPPGTPLQLDASSDLDPVPPGSQVQKEVGYVVDSAPILGGCELLVVLEPKHLQAGLRLATSPEALLTAVPIAGWLPTTEPPLGTEQEPHA